MSADAIAGGGPTIGGHPVRVLGLTNLYPRPGRPGLAPFNRQQFSRLAAMTDLEIIVPVPWPEAVRSRLRGHPLPARVRNEDGIDIGLPRFFYPPMIGRAWYGPFLVQSVRAEFRRRLESLRPDVVLGCWAHPDGWAAAHLADLAGLPSVIKVVGSDILVAARSGPRRWAAGEGLRRASAVVAVSRDLAGQVVKMGVRPDSVHVVPEGLDAVLFRPGDRSEARRRLDLDPDRPIILFVGNLLVSKGTRVLVDAMAELGRMGHPARCLLVGGGRDAGRLRSAISKLGLDGVVTLAGPRPHQDLADFYRACDVVALPSFSEGIPNVLREAAACGRPYVASRVGGIPEIATDHASLLVDPGDPKALAAGLIEALTWGPQPPSVGVSWDESARLLADILRTSARCRTGASSLPC